ncbi:MAG: hypothetical protein ACJA1R_002476 [Flavobacteriales bacterium]|jgi:hypothetical protein
MGPRTDLRRRQIDREARPQRVDGLIVGALGLTEVGCGSQARAAQVCPALGPVVSSRESTTQQKRSGSSRARLPGGVGGDSLSVNSVSHVSRRSARA